MHTTRPVHGKEGSNRFLTRRSPCQTSGTLVRHLEMRPNHWVQFTEHGIVRRERPCVMCNDVSCRVALCMQISLSTVRTSEKTLHVMACTTSH
jgi:hypothetical protein